jgi:hypothetical protein
MKLEFWPLNKLIPYIRNPRKNDAAVDRIVSSIKEFGFKIPVLAKSDGSVTCCSVLTTSQSTSVPVLDVQLGKSVAL